MLKTIDCGYTLEPPRRGDSNEYLQSMFWSNNKKNRYTLVYPSLYAQYSPYYLPLNVLLLPKDQTFLIFFAITAAGVVPCGGRKKSPRTSSIVQIIFLFRSFEISKDIQSVQNTHV